MWQKYLVVIMGTMAAAFALMWVLDRLADRVTEKAFIGILITAIVTVMLLITI